MTGPLGEWYYNACSLVSAANFAKSRFVPLICRTGQLNEKWVVGTRNSNYSESQQTKKMIDNFLKKKKKMYFMDLDASFFYREKRER